VPGAPIPDDVLHLSAIVCSASDIDCEICDENEFNCAITLFNVEVHASTFAINYEASPTYIATENSESFALLQLNGLDPATGDISRIKVFTNNAGTVGDWELVNDIELAETEIFIPSTASLYPDQSIGIFTTQSIIDTYWEAHTYQGRTETTAPTLTWTTASINNAMLISSATDITANNAVHVAQIKSAYSGIFIATSSYKVTVGNARIATGNDVEPTQLTGALGTGVPTKELPMLENAPLPQDW
jgi:hypothetical protein